MLYLATKVPGRANGGLHEILTVERSVIEEDKAAFGGNESVKKIFHHRLVLKQYLESQDQLSNLMLK